MMQVSLSEVRRVAVAYLQSRATLAANIHKVDRYPPITETDRRLALELARQLAKQPEVRVDRVAEVRQQIEAGTYRFSSRLVAGAILRRLVADRIG